MQALVLVWVIYSRFRLTCVGTVDGSLKSFWTYVREQTRAHRVLWQAHMYTEASIRRLRLHTAHVMGLVKMHDSRK